MAKALKSEFVFSSTRTPVELNVPLWKLKQERPGEYDEILNQLEQNQSDFKKLLGSQDVQIQGSRDNKPVDPDAFLANCCAANVSFGWLLQICLNNLEFDSDVVSLLKDLQDSFSPLKLSSTSANQDEMMSAELGSSFKLEVLVTGVPSPRFCWFKAPLLGGDWVALQAAPGPENALKIQDFETDDAGIYKCHISHKYTVSTPNGEEPGIFSPSYEVTVSKGSIWIREVKPKFAKLPIGTPEAIFEVQAMSEEPLTYEWFHDDIRLSGQQSSNLTLNCITLEMAGGYFCKISNSYISKVSEVIHLEVFVPDLKALQRGDLKFENEAIRIVQQPSYDQSRKSAVGEKISLACLAVCKYPLKYEWLKQGLRKDLIANKTPWDQFLSVIPVSLGPQLVDIATDVPAPISGWIYQCIITCPNTGERVSSNEVRVPVSTYSSQERSLPVFKVALVICQEQYECVQYFHQLRAPKNDGQALIKALQEMDFCVMAFANLTLSEVRDSLDLFCSFVDENTYALFYYNGHALGYGNDVYLVASDTQINKNIVVHNELIWHGEIESRLDSCNPLLCIAIYDSCRDKPPEVIAGIVKEIKHEPVALNSSFCIGYGTRPSMRNFEKLDRSGISQGLYMKNLLKHIKIPDLTIGGVFEHLFSSFTLEEDSSVVERMKPEYKCSTKQLFYLTAPLRKSVVGHQYLRYFKMFRYEAALEGQRNFEGHFSFNLGIRWDGTNLAWITRDESMNPLRCEVIIQFRVTPSQFDNEAEMSICYNKGRESQGSPSHCSFPYGNVSVQIIPGNVHMTYGGVVLVEGVHHDLKAAFQPCKKRTGYTHEDGPLFQLQKPGEGEVIGRCGLLHLQSVDSDSVKLKVVLNYNDESIPCRGIMAFPVPIVKNFPKLKIRNVYI